MNKTFRKLHRKAAPVIFLPLLLTTLTGIAYPIGENWFNLPDEAGDFLMELHEGKFLGNPLVPVYVLLVGVGLLGMIITGMVLLKKQTLLAAPKLDWRWVHRVLSPLLFLPLALSAVTGIGYRLGRNWFSIPDEQAKLLLKLHEGAFLGSTLKNVYILLVGLGMVALLITGIQMISLFRKRRLEKQA